MEWAARAVLPWHVPRGNDAVLDMGTLRNAVFSTDSTVCDALLPCA